MTNEAQVKVNEDYKKVNNAYQQETREKALAEVKLYQANDWDIKEETPEYFLLKRNKATAVGHFIIVLFFWWTCGIANLIYWLALKQTKKVIK